MKQKMLEKRKKQQILRGKRILLAEDNEFNIEIAQALLSALGAEVTAVTDGKLAVETVQREHLQAYDFVFMDIEMPNMDGWSAARKIRELDYPEAETIPIFAVTSNTAASDIQRCMDIGFNEHIAKPLSTEVLLEKLKKYL